LKYCQDFNIPIDYLSDILRDSKVNPMIRGKGFEFSTLVAFQNILRSDIWEVSKPNMNAQAMQHDVDILVKHIPSGKTISVECKLSKKDSFRISKTGETTAAVKCMRSRTLGQEIIEDRAPIMGVTVEQLNAHKDNYLTTDFDVVASSFGNAFYTTDKESGDYIWTPASSHQEVIKKILQNPNVDLKKAAFDYILVAKASDLSPSSGFYACARRTCKHRDSCAFIPNYPVVKFDNSSGAPIKPWNSLRELENVLLEVLSKK
jgi:hypothetical protein